MGKLAEQMATAMNHGGNLRIDRVARDGEGLCMGRVSLGILNAVDQPLSNQAEDCHIVFHGELIKNYSSMSDPEYVLKRYCDLGDRFASELDGIFHFAIHDKRTQEIKLFSDKFGLQPLYYSVLSDGIAFAGEVKALLKDERVDKTPDDQSFADFFHYGQVLGQKTLFKNIKLLGPGAVLTFSLEDCSASLRKYWDLGALFVEKGAYHSTVAPDDVVSALVESIIACSANKSILGLSLSGGLDSRGILAGLGNNAAGLATYTLGLSGCADQGLAEMMVRVAKTDHEFIELGQGYIEGFENMAHRMILFSDGMYHPHESTEMLALEYFKKARFKILLRGHGGEIAKAALAYPVMATPDVCSATTGDEILTRIFHTTNLVIRDVDPGALFTDSFQQVMKQGPYQSLSESCGEVSERLAPADVCIYYYIVEHIRRQVVASLEIFRTQIEIRMPYVDASYIGKLLKLPVSERNEGEIHVKLVKRCMPELLKIPNSNTGAPLDAGLIRLFLMDKFNSLMKKLSVKGFRHYTEFQKWHRTGFKESSEKMIFSDETRSRGIYNMDHLRVVFDEHVSGQREYGHLLGTIVGLEQWFRCFVD